MTKNDNVSRPLFAFLALFFGMVAFAGSVGHFWLGPIEPPPKLEDTIADQAVKIRDKVVAKLQGKKMEEKPQEIDWNYDRIALGAIAGASVFAILFAILGFIRHEPIRIIGSAFLLGSLALALQYLVFAVGAIVCAILIAAVLGGLGFG